MDLNGASVAAPLAKAVQAAALEPAAPSDLSSKPLGAPNNAEPLVDRGNSVVQAEAAPALSPKPAQPPAPAAPAVSEAPKPVSVEDVPDTEGPNATTGKPAQEDANALSVNSNASAGKTTDQSSEPAKPEPVPARDEPIIGKPPSTVDTNASKVAQSETRSNDTSQTAAEPVTATAEVVGAPAPGGVSAPPASGEHEAAPLATRSENKVESKPDEDKKRKADALDPDVAPEAAGSDGQLTEGADTANKKRKPGRPPAASNGNSTAGHEDHEGLGHKLAKKAKKVLPAIGKTERKTRSQGPA